MAQDFIFWVSSQRQNVFVASVVNLAPADSLCNNNAINTGQSYIDATNHFNGQIYKILTH